jgi:hypothetical protein
MMMRDVDRPWTTARSAAGFFGCATAGGFTGSFVFGAGTFV